jgi:hypothetical protein
MKVSDHIVRKANKKEAERDCCGDRYECNVDYVCSCGKHACISCMERHIFDLHKKKEADGNRHPQS